MTASRSTSRPATPAQADRITRVVLLRAAVTGGIVAATGFGATYGLFPKAPWALAAAASAGLFSLALIHPLRGRTSLGPLTWVATAAVVVALVISLWTGGFRSVNGTIDLMVFIVAATLYPPPVPVLAALVNCALLAVPDALAGRLGADWRPALATTGAFVAAGLYSPVAYTAVALELRHQRGLRASAAIGRALVTLDLDTILPAVAAEIGALLEASRVALVVASGHELGAAERWAAWPAPCSADVGDQGALEAQARHAMRDGRVVVCPVRKRGLGGDPAGRRAGPAAAPAAPLQAPSMSGDARAVPSAQRWEVWSDDARPRRRPAAVTALALPLGQGTEVVGGLAVAAAAGRSLPPGAVEAVRELGDYAALGIRAAWLHEERRHQAMVDPVTHLYNARYLEARLDEEVARARRHGQPLSLLFLDSDALKFVNDRYGHQYGDRLVRSLAQTILQHVRAEDVPIRYAGDEFIILLPATDWPEAADIAERLRHHAGQVPVGPRGEARATVSVGVATLPVHAATAEELVARADHAMYVAKSAGKDCVAVYGRGPQTHQEIWIG